METINISGLTFKIFNKEKNKKILFTGSNGFPFGSAVMQRQIQLANILLDTNYRVIVLNRRGAHSKSITRREHISMKGIYKGIDYIYCSIIPYRSKKFIIRNIFKVIGIIGEFFTILYYRFFKNVKYLFNNSTNLTQLKYYYFFAKTLNIEFIYDYVEMVSSINNRHIQGKENIQNKFDDQFYHYVDKLIIISSFLEKHIQNAALNINSIKIPPIIDFSFIDGIGYKDAKKPYFLFCGSVAYLDIIHFIIDSYEKSISKNIGVSLRLVINGKDKELDQIRKHIKMKKLQQHIHILSDLPYSDLISQYKSARALLIPIKNNLQDKARFPFKICEYVASRRPIITSDVPLINEFFEDNITAIIAKNDDVFDFSDKLDLLAQNSILADKVGKNGYMMGERIFNYKSYCNELNKFLQGIPNK